MSLLSRIIKMLLQYSSDGVQRFAQPQDQSKLFVAIRWNRNLLEWLTRLRLHHFASLKPTLWLRVAHVARMAAKSWNNDWMSILKCRLHYANDTSFGKLNVIPFGSQNTVYFVTTRSRVCLLGLITTILKNRTPENCVVWNNINILSALHLHQVLRQLYPTNPSNSRS